MLKNKLFLKFRAFFNLFPSVPKGSLGAGSLSLLLITYLGLLGEWRKCVDLDSYIAMFIEVVLIGRSKMV